MKIQYITNARIPTEKAHGLQIMTMCSEFSKLDNDLELIIPKRFNPIKKDPFKFYDIERNFKIKKKFNIDTQSLIFAFVPEFIKKIFFWIQALSFSLSALRHLNKEAIIYSRDEFTLFFLLLLFKTKCIYEVHSLPENTKFIYKYIFKKCNKIITINSYLKNKIRLLK